MRRSSIKLRITLWYAAFIALIAALALGAMMLSQDRLSKDYYYEKLSAAADEAAQSIRVEDGKIQLDFQSDSGVRVTVLSAEGELLIGKRHFTPTLREGVLRLREGHGEANWYLLDRPVALPDGQEVWLRCYISTSLSERTNHSMLTMLLVMLPVLTAVVIFGGYRMTKYAFSPIDEITRTAAQISDSGDLSQRTRLEGQTDEVGRLAAAFDAMIARLERSLENEKQFISDASHELRTPLSVICAQSEYALAPGRSAQEKDEALRVILERGQKTSEMLARMLTISRLDRRSEPPNLEDTDLSLLAESLAQEMAPQAQARGMDLSCEIEPGVRLVCDELLMMRMLANLIQNAIQHGREGGRVRVCLRRGGGRVFLSVADDGPGIAPEEQEKIWNRFYQIDRARGGGAGLGLPIVRRIAEAHGGQVELESAPGEGSCFTASFPAPER